MNPYVKTILPFLTEEPIDGALLQEQLYRCYQNLHPYDSQAVKEGFSQLNDVLSRLSLREYDRVWDLTCALCIESERSAFLAGLQVGIQLSCGQEPGET